MKAKYLRSLIIILLPIMFFGCNSAVDTTKLKSTIAEEEKELSELRMQQDKYGDGSVIFLMGKLRESIILQHVEMLKMRLNSFLFFVNLNFKIDGTQAEIKSDPSKLEKLELALQEAQKEYLVALEKAEKFGGLIGTMAMMEASTKSLKVAQISYLVSAERFGFPAYITPKVDVAEKKNKLVDEGANGL